MLKKILILLVVAIAISCVVIAMQPGHFSVERSATMNAPPAAVFAQVDDLKAWDGWSPWKKLDPDAKATLSNPSSGKGATNTWDGNAEVGAGTLTILESIRNEKVVIEQAFVRPFEGKAQMSFVLAAAGDKTKVTWRIEGANDFIGKAMCLVMNMESVLGKPFEEGLANIKAIVEQGPASK